MKTFSTWIIAFGLLASCERDQGAKEANSTTEKKNDDFDSLAVNLELRNQENENLHFVASVHNNSTDVLYVIKPSMEFGSVAFAVNKNGNYDYGSISNTSTLAGFDGAVMRHGDIMLISIDAKITNDKKIVFPSSGQSLEIPNSEFEIASNISLLVSDFRSEKCKKIRAFSGFVKVKLSK